MFLVQYLTSCLPTYLYPKKNSSYFNKTVPIDQEEHTHKLKLQEWIKGNIPIYNLPLRRY